MEFLRFASRPFSTVALFALVIGSQSVSAKSTIEVGPGSTYVVTKINQKILVDEWIMNDNSTVLIEKEVTNWIIHATRASFGKNTQIIGRGRRGSDGLSSRQHGSDGGECKDGSHGQAGASGSPGGDGVDISITIGLVNVDELLIDVRGGDGGNGGNGANGGKGGRASCGRVCSGQEGGNGGRGGDGGKGGAGGAVKVNYWVAGQSPITFNRLGSGLRVDTSGGSPGKGGNGGNGGERGDGRRCPPFKSIKRSPGAPGKHGQDGKAGMPGLEGAAEFRVVPNPSK